MSASNIRPTAVLRVPVMQRVIGDETKGSIFANDPALIQRVRTHWLAYKRRVKTNQTIVANEYFNMSQSALGQYLRGDVHLNEAFIKKFCELTGTPRIALFFDKRDLPIRLKIGDGFMDTQEGSVCDSICVYTDSVHNDAFLAEMGISTNMHRKGDYLILEPTEQVFDGDEVVLLQGTLDAPTLVANGLVFIHDSEYEFISTELKFSGSGTLPSEYSFFRVVGVHKPRPAEDAVSIKTS